MQVRSAPTVSGGSLILLQDPKWKDAKLQQEGSAKRLITLLRNLNYSVYQPGGTPITSKVSRFFVIH